MILHVWNRRVQVWFLLCLLVCGGVFSCTEKANATVPVAENNEKPKEYDLYLLIGQSNMAGRGKMLPSDETALIDGVWLLNADDEPEPAISPLNKYSTIRKELSMQQICPGNGFSALVHQVTGRKVLLVVNARGGSALDEWAPGSPYLNEAIRRTKAAQEHGTLKAILWHQGESDQSKAATYLSRLSTMVAALRTEVGDVPFIAGEIAKWRTSGEALNAEIRRISEVIPASGWVSSEGLTPLIDTSDPHFDRDSQLKLGERYAERYFTLAGIPYEPPQGGDTPGDGASGHLGGDFEDFVAAESKW